MKIHVAVLFGGKSVEHEVSVISALQAIQSMNKDKYAVYPIYITKKNELYWGEDLDKIEEYKNIPALLQKSTKINIVTDGSKTYLVPQQQKRFSKAKPIACIDVAFPIVHGTNVEDGALQGFLKTLNLPFVGCDVLASAICMDKFAMKIMLKEAGFPVLDGIRFTAQDYKNEEKILADTESRFGYPVIVKPVDLGSSVGISKAHTRAELRAAVYPHRQPLFVQGIELPAHRGRTHIQFFRQLFRARLFFRLQNLEDFPLLVIAHIVCSFCRKRAVKIARLPFFAQISRYIRKIFAYLIVLLYYNGSVRRKSRISPGRE